MPKISHKQLANVNSDWSFEITRLDPGIVADHPAIQSACLIEIHRSLQRIESLLACPNMAAGLKSMQALERLAREFWVKPDRRKSTSRKTRKRVAKS